MAENVSIKKSPIDSILECPLCLHQLTLPQTLQQCLHSYCKSCLDKVPQKIQDGRLGWLCPICEHFTKCDEIQQNTFIEELQKIQADQDVCDKIKCGQCSDDCSPATWKCTDCKIALCESAKITHLKIPMLKGHEVVPLDIDAEKLIDNILFCKVHEDIPAQLNCRDCDRMICFRCNITDHKHHNAESIEEALERMLPETESSIRLVDENIAIIEIQIQGVNKEIEQTKESYASIRMQMDDHLEKVICQMRAMKAQMEENVNEQESIALDTLKELRQQLENQRSQATMLSNLTAVVTTKTRHTSQLQQLQTGLLEKVKSAGEVKNQSLSFNLPVTNFLVAQRFTEEIDKVFGKVDFDVKEQIISISGENYTKPNQFLCSDFNKLAATQYKKDKEILVDVGWCNRLSYIDNKIWLLLDTRNQINIYDEDGELENTIGTGDKAITMVKIAHNGDVICAGVSGLFATDRQFSKWARLSKGNFSDVVVANDQFIALQYDFPSVQTYKQDNSLMAATNNMERTWRKFHAFKLHEDVKMNSNSIMCIIDEKYLLISSTETGSLYKFTCEGEYLDSCKDLWFSPMMCGTDRTDKVLLADYSTGTMYLFKPLSEKKIQRTAVLSSVKTAETRSVVIDRNNIWLLSGRKDTFKLIRFASEL